MAGSAEESGGAYLVGDGSEPLDVLVGQIGRDVDGPAGGRRHVPSVDDGVHALEP